MKGASLLHRASVLFAAGILVLVTAAGAMGDGKRRQGEVAEFLLAIYHQARGEAAAKKVEVKESEWRIELATLTVSAGRVSFQVRNVGSYPHALSIQGQGVHLSSLEIGPGKTGTLDIELKKTGQYKVICPLEGHAERGMTGTLTVKAKTS